MNKGLVIGKFLPPHEGHHHLIDVAEANCYDLDVIICVNPNDPISYQDRRNWIKQRHPNIIHYYMSCNDQEDNDDSEYWAKKTLNFLGYAPDFVFTSEDYGDAYAHYMGCQHISVDRERLMYPVSGTQVRDNPFAHWDMIDENLAAYYCLRVVLIGAESTGKTTLAKDLAKELNTVWTPEFGRTYSDTKTNGLWWSDDFRFIAGIQQQIENKLAQQANKVLICDTDAVTTFFWEYALTGRNKLGFNDYLDRRENRIYILTDADIPFEQDGTRDEERRNHMKLLMEVNLDAVMGIEHYRVSGSRQERVEQVKLIIEKEMEKRYGNN